MRAQIQSCALAASPFSLPHPPSNYIFVRYILRFYLSTIAERIFQEFIINVRLKRSIVLAKIVVASSPLRFWHKSVLLIYERERFTLRILLFSKANKKNRRKIAFSAVVDVDKF